MKPLTVLAMPSNEGAIGNLRIIEPCKQLAEAGLIELIMFHDAQQVNHAQMVETIKKTDILWFQGVMNQQFLWQILNCRRFNPKIKLVMDIDDNLFHVNPWNPSYTAFTTDEYVHTADQAIKLPKNRNLARIRMLETLMMEADAMIVTTDLLAAAYSHLQDNIYIMPNRLIWENWHFPHIPKRDDGIIRISWSGGSSHLVDWLECHGACHRIITKYPNVKMQFQTSPQCYADFIRDFGRDHVEIHDWVDYTGHSFRMNCLKPDIAVIPLHEDEFSVCKSDLKYAEYSALGVPSICSNIPPYSKIVQHGKTGLLAADDLEFEQHLETLINDKVARETIGGLAFEWARKERCLEVSINSIKEILDDIMFLPNWHIMPSKYITPNSIIKEVATA
jgi:glycosyltransferase involved in cell wall biosynthesis